jgi:hypothetical protein
MIAEWAKENKVDNWEHFYRAYHPAEQAKRRQRAIRNYNRRNGNFTYKKSFSRKYS